MSESIMQPITVFILTECSECILEMYFYIDLSTLFLKHLQEILDIAEI